MPKSERAWVWLWVSLLVVLLDQGSKWVAEHSLVYNKPVAILPWLNFTLRYNNGAAYGFLSQLNGCQVFILSLITIIVLIALLVWLARTARRAVWTALPLALIIGGAVGNLIDRLRVFYVTDFIDFHVGAWHFATFNIADTAISIGAAMLVIKLLFSKNP